MVLFSLSTGINVAIRLGSSIFHTVVLEMWRWRRFCITSHPSPQSLLGHDCLAVTVSYRRGRQYFTAFDWALLILSIAVGAHLRVGHHPEARSETQIRVLNLVTVDPLPRADKRPSVGYTSITQSAQLLTFRIFLFKPVELYQTTINSSYCDGVLKL